MSYRTRCSRPVVPSLLVATALSGWLAACGASQYQSPLDVERVVLYQSGVGYIEQSGMVSGDTMTLQIRPDQINDLLATLVVLDESGGGASVSLPLANAANLPWSGLPDPASGSEGLMQLLSAFRGADVTIRHGEERTRGRVVGTEFANGVPTVTLFTSGEALVPIAIDDIERIDVQNDSLAIALERSLDRSMSDSDWKPIEVTLHFTNDGRRRVQLAYVVEMPAWKPTYRAVVRDDGQLLLQGWGIVDNVSGEDWNDIRMSLTAGTPLSFRYDLYTPIHVPRPDLTGYGVTSTANLTPPSPISAMPAPAPMAPGGPGYGAAAGRSAATAYGDYAMAEEAEAPYQMNYNDVGRDEASAVASEMQGLFRYDLGMPVTLPDQSSTLVPLLNEVIDGDEVLMFQPGQGGSTTHPYRSLRLNNDTGYPIQAAPISIYREGTFVGEGITPVVPDGQNAYIPYALDNRVSVAVSTQATPGEVRLVRIAGGYVHTESAWVQESVISATHSLAEPERLLVQVSRLAGYEILDAPADLEEHDGFYLFPVDLQPGAMGEVRVRQSMRQPAQVDVFDPRVPALFLAVVSSGELPAATQATVRELLGLLDQMAQRNVDAEALRLRRNDLQARAQELRNNINTLGNNPSSAELRAELTQRLAEQDTLSAEVAADLVRISEEISELRSTVVARMGDLTLDFESSEE